jgi:carbon-monoxide dehydrogenase large subunit
VVTGSTPYGQGHVTTWAMLASDRLGVPMDRIEVVHGDTDTVPSSGMTGGSRSVQMAGSAVADASEKLVAAATDVAAELLEASAADVVFDGERGEFHVVGTPAVSVGWDRVAEARADDPLETISDLTQDGSTFPFGTHVAVVEVDEDTGEVDLIDYVAVDDCGPQVNPMIVEGQIHGGIVQGVAQALWEEAVYDADGNLRNPTFIDYCIPTAAEVPSFQLDHTVTPSPTNPLGVKGIGEAGTIGSAPTVINAIVDALGHLGITDVVMPATPERVWAAIREARSNGAGGAGGNGNGSTSGSATEEAQS